MKITQSSSFWIIIVCAVLGLLVGMIHWILGLIFFFLLLSKTLYTAVIADMAYGALEYHHDRNDERAKKEIASLMLLKAQQAGVKIKRINKL